jgi:hypothetical protein
MATATITLTTAGTGTGPFDLYSDVDGYVTPFETGVDKTSLVSGYTTSLVYNGTTIIRVQSTSIQCTNYVDLPVSGITTTTTTSTTTSTTTTTTANPYGTFGVSNQSGSIIAGTWTVFINSVPYNDFSTGYASIANNTFVNLPLNQNFNPPRTGTFKIVFTPGSGMSTSRSATLTGGSNIGPASFALVSGNYEATINVISPSSQFSYSIQIT